MCKNVKIQIRISKSKICHSIFLQNFLSIQFWNLSIVFEENDRLR